MKAYIFKLVQNKGIILCFQPIGLDSHGMNQWYRTYVYKVLASDTVRNDAYRKVIEKFVRGKSVLELGTGPFVFLADMCVRAGANKVYAIEENEKSFRCAENKVKRERTASKFRVLHGYSTDVQIEEKCEVLLHDIVGSIGSSEGMALAVKDVKEKFLKDNATYIPHGCTTFICPVSPLRLSKMDAMVSGLAGGRFHVREIGCYKVFNFPATNMISSPAEFEKIVFKENFQLIEESDMEFEVSRDCLFDGFVFFIRLFLDAETVVDALLQKTNWSTPYIKLFSKPIKLAVGDVIRVKARRDVLTSLAKYEIDVCVRPKSSGVEHRRYYQLNGT